MLTQQNGKITIVDAVRSIIFQSSAYR